MLSVINHHGVYKDVKNYNVAFAAPLVAVVEEAFVKYRRHGVVFGLRKELVKEANRLLDEVHESAEDLEPALKDELHVRIFNCREGHLAEGLSQLKKDGNSKVWETQRHLSDPAFFSYAVLDRLRKTYDEVANGHKGRNSIARMKVSSFRHSCFVQSHSEVAPGTLRGCCERRCPHTIPRHGAGLH